VVAIRAGTRTENPEGASDMALEAALRRAGVREVRFHDLRHTYATLALRDGVPVKVVSETLGHASITLTLDTYSHVLPDMQDDEAARMERLLGDTGTEGR
jgi:integrase